MSTMTVTSNPIRFEHSASQVRLTQRGRIVVLVAAMLVVLGAALFLGASSMASSEPGTEQQTEVVMVGYGETLWDISADLATDGQVRDMMRQIKDLNALDSAMLIAGQELHVPVAG